MHYCTSYGPDKFGQMHGRLDALTHGRMHIHRIKIVTRLPTSGLDKNVVIINAVMMMTGFGGFRVVRDNSFEFTLG